METTTTITTEDPTTCECCESRESDTYCDRCEKQVCWHCTESFETHRQTYLEPAEHATYCSDCVYEMEPDGDYYDDPEDYCDY